MSLRILVANEEAIEAGGVHTYLGAVMPALAARGHQVAFLHHDEPTRAAPALAEPSIGVRALGLDEAIARVEKWAPDVCFSHNMHPLAVDAALARRWPVVKMMHGYFGTCISGQKAWLRPAGVPCGKPFDVSCLAYYYPRRCGEANPLKMVGHLAWAVRQKAMLDRYAAVVVASDHMRAEYEGHGVPPGKLRCVPLFAPPIRHAASQGRERHVVFLGRMTDLKGGELLITAVSRLSRNEDRVRLTMAGDGSARGRWQKMAETLGVEAVFPGWLDSASCADLLDRASVLAVPSVWPEPFGLVGLEAAAQGVPSVAFDVGGIREWLEDGMNGLLAGPRPGAEPLARALASVLFDDPLRARLAQGARTVAGRLTVDRHVDALLETALWPAAVRAGTTGAASLAS
jgi:glycosyltransferase involved in cell wall biosynthesis